MSRVLPTGTVTLVFSDIEGSTRLLHELGDAYGELLADHHRLLREVWERFGGVEVDTEGDAFFVAFPEAGAAVSAAAEAQRALARHDFPDRVTVRVRIGVHTGTPRIQGDQYWGSDVHYAARIGAAANGGQVLLSATTRSLVPSATVESLGDQRLKDFDTAREIFHLTVDGRAAGEFPPPRTLSRIRTNLPVREDGLLGRAEDLTELTRLITLYSLVTVVGAGGSGKTSLGIELASTLLEEFDGVFFVALEQTNSSLEVFETITRTLGLAERTGMTDLERVLDWVGARRVLFVLDNFEQVVDDAAGDVSRLATAGPDVRVLITSQTPLRVRGERVLRLAPLAVPDSTDDAGTPDALADMPAVALLVERAQQSGADFSVTTTNATAVAALVRALEGMPLAIELAAARLKLLDPAALLLRLERELDALGRGPRDLPARQRGLRATLEWTSALLEPESRALLTRLAVFDAGFTSTLAELAFGDCLDELSDLLDVSLLVRDANGRLWLRPPVRRFALERLLQDGDEPGARSAVASALAQLAEPYEFRWMAAMSTGFPTTLAESANIMAALEWTESRLAEEHDRLAAATGWFMSFAGLEAFARPHLELGLSRATDAALRARLLQALGGLGLSTSDPTTTAEAARAWAELENSEGEFISALHGANLFCHSGNTTEAEILLARARAADGRLPKDVERSWMLDAVSATVLLSSGKPEEARARLEPWLAGAQPGGGREYWVATVLGDIALEIGEYERARRLFALCGRSLWTAGFAHGTVVQGLTIALSFIAVGRLEDAAFTVSVCDLVCGEHGLELSGVFATFMTQAREPLTPGILVEAHQRASELGMDRAINLMFDIADPGGLRPRDPVSQA